VLTTPAILAQEERLLEIAERRDHAGGTGRAVDDPGLGAAQRDAAAAVAGTRPLALVVGPAGTGKTTAMRPGVEALRRQGRSVFGVAPSATAAEVLADDTGIDCDTIDKLLVEHRAGRRPAPRFDLPVGSTVICDEAAMVSTPNLAGDPLQFSAVGRSGMFAHLVQTVGAVELDRVHRFAAPWERSAKSRTCVHRTLRCV
jgi:ATP-dependent exoDNAse (exonuclease V) alpha subunit